MCFVTVSSRYYDVRDHRTDRLSLRGHSQGFFPQQDTGLIIGLSEAAQDISYPGDGRAPAGAAQPS